MIGACPNCGLDLERFDTITLGDLSVIDGGAAIRWKGRAVRLPPARRLLVCALARDAGHVVRGHALIQAMGGDRADDPGNLLAVQICKTRSAFRDLDPDFDMIETIWGTGVRWREAA